MDASNNNNNSKKSKTKKEKPGSTGLMSPNLQKARTNPGVSQATMESS